MDGEFNDVVDDVPADDISGIEDTPVDISEDEPENIPEDIPEDVPEDIPEDIPEDVPEDIPEDIPEDEPEDIPEDIPEDVPEDIPEDIPEDEPEDVPEDVFDDVHSTDMQGDIAGKTFTSETKDIDSNTSGDELPPDIQNDMVDEGPVSENEDTVLTNNQDTNDNFGDVVNDVDDEKKLSDLSDKVRYLDKMRNDAEFTLSYESTRKDDWDVVRGRLSDEYKSVADNLNDMGAVKQTEYNKLMDEYFATDTLPDSPEKFAKLQDLTNRSRELGSEMDDINTRARYADTLSQDLARGLDLSKRTFYIGVGGKNFTDIHRNMIQEQGNAVPDFRGTCGDCSAANTMNALGDTKTEAEVVQRARDLKACTDIPVPDFLPEQIKNRIRSKNGGTSVAERSKILDSFGYDCDNRQGQSLNDIANQLENGKGAIINVDHRVLDKRNDISLLNPKGTDHALTITGIEKDASGNPIGLWIHNTGVHNDMGNAFYCNANDYEIWKNTPNCTVQYVTKR